MRKKWRMGAGPAIRERARGLAPGAPTPPARGHSVLVPPATRDLSAANLAAVVALAVAASAAEEAHKLDLAGSCCPCPRPAPDRHQGGVVATTGRVERPCLGEPQVAGPRANCAVTTEVHDRRDRR